MRWCYRAAVTVTHMHEEKPERYPKATGDDSL
jgi:hypothetical protein